MAGYCKHRLSDPCVQPGQAQAYCTVPVYSSCPTAIAIHPTNSNLVVVHADQQIFEYSLVQKEYTEWSRKLQKQGLQPPLDGERQPPSHTSPSILKIQLTSSSTTRSCSASLTRICPSLKPKTPLYNQMTLRSLSESERIMHSHAFKICKNFQHLLCVRLLEDHSLVVVERPLLDIQSQLPAPVRQKKFAT
ncbi:hypothetical protein KUCAC02_036100 [Chaenocephalus aceratus]|nr:hypothetical protein KUCAC02_036100 [Chaenocephalus aceratus]